MNLESLFVLVQLFQTQFIVKLHKDAKIFCQKMVTKCSAVIIFDEALFVGRNNSLLSSMRYPNI